MTSQELPMVIEWLQFWVEEELREQFVQHDADIWTTALSKYNGFLGKEVWISHEDLNEVTMVIRWNSTDSWYSIPSDELQQIEAAFEAAIGQENYKLLVSKPSQVRKFWQPVN